MIYYTFIQKKYFQTRYQTNCNLENYIDKH